MKLNERLILLIGGLACIGAGFLPYLKMELPFGINSLTYSGERLVRGLLDAFQIIQDKNGKELLDMLGKLWNSTNDPAAKGTMVGMALTLAGPLIFAFFGLGYIVRAIIGKHYGWGIIFNILFLGFSWLMFFLASKQLSAPGLPLNFNFFKLANVGYWLAFAGMFIAAFSSFFDPNTKAKK